MTSQQFTLENIKHIRQVLIFKYVWKKIYSRVTISKGELDKLLQGDIYFQRFFLLKSQGGEVPKRVQFHVFCADQTAAAYELAKSSILGSTFSLMSLLSKRRVSKEWDRETSADRDI